MKVVSHTVFSILSVLILFIFSGCSENEKPEQSMTLSQVDIDRLVQHKKEIDEITKKYDQILIKTKAPERPDVIQKGKEEINNYLRSKNLDPTFFMRKSKKILKGYIAFYRTSDSSVKRRRKILEEQNLSKNELESNIKAFKKERERMFKDLTSELSDYEIELIRTNMKKLETVINL